MHVKNTEGQESGWFRTTEKEIGTHTAHRIPSKESGSAAIITCTAHFHLLQLRNAKGRDLKTDDSESVQSWSRITALT